MPSTITLDIDIDTILDAALTALLRSTMDLETGDPLNVEFNTDDVAAEARAELREEIEAFVEDNAEHIHAALGAGLGYSQESVGCDIALTRNHHGAGFWDRGLEATGTHLTDAAHSMGSFELFPHPDGRLHV